MSIFTYYTGYTRAPAATGDVRLLFSGIRIEDVALKVAGHTGHTGQVLFFRRRQNVRNEREQILPVYDTVGRNIPETFVQ